MGAGYVDALVKSNKIMAATLFTEDLERSKEFYAGVFGLPVHWEDADSAVFLFGDTMVNLLRASNARELIAPAPAGGPQTGARMQFTIWADDVDAVCDELAKRGVTLINGPVDRPWGIRTACFADPSGHIWEIAADLPKN
jgi:lactoylglutathione lyase